MKPWENFRLVSGYLPEIDRLPATALRLGLLRRVSAVLNDSAAPHSRLYWDLLETFVESLRADSVTFEIDTDRESLSFTSVSSMRQYVAGRPQADCVFNRATFFLQGRASAFIDVEPWAAVGGPFPYHDSWTFAIYRDTDDTTRLKDACFRVCTQHGMPVLEEIRGLVRWSDEFWPPTAAGFFDDEIDVNENRTTPKCAPERARLSTAGHPRSAPSRLGTHQRRP